MHKDYKHKKLDEVAPLLVVPPQRSSNSRHMQLFISDIKKETPEQR